MKGYLRRRTLESFDYQWANLPVGQSLLSDPAFSSDVARILWREELCVDPEWFVGKRVLDVGCGQGRWTQGFLEMGATVTAVDAAPSACRAVLARFGPRVEVIQADVLEPSALTGRCFDLVFAWGVLHHTGDTRKALRNCCELTDPDGLIYVYLYSRSSLSRRQSLRLRAGRTLLLPFSPETKRRILSRRYRPERLHNAFDVWAPPINDRFDEGQVRSWFSSAGFSTRRTIHHPELFIEGWREGATASRAFLQPSDPPYWFQQGQEGA
jgi:2-polyprenyl-3-methyl-5-hydroxy-6-metoxy-1,4-benzoquinol methylase